MTLVRCGPEGLEELFDESLRAGKREGDRVPPVVLHGQLEVVIPVHAFFRRPMAVREALPGPVQHLLNLRHHGGMLLGPGGGHRIERRDAFSIVAEFERHVTHRVYRLSS